MAKAAGISRPIVHEHSGDLVGLLDALVKREMSRRLPRSLRVSEGPIEGNPIELMRASQGAYLSAVTCKPEPRAWY